MREYIVAVYGLIVKPWLADNARGLRWAALVVSHLAAAGIGYILGR